MLLKNSLVYSLNFRQLQFAFLVIINMFVPVIRALLTIPRPFEQIYILS